MQKLEEKLLEYFNGNLGEKESHEVKNWIELSEENKKAFRELEKIYEASGFDDSFQPDVDSAWKIVSAHIAKPKAKQVYFELKKWYRIAAVLVLGLSIGILAYMSSLKEMQTLTSGDGVMDVTLPDGTLIFLNKGTVIKYSKDFDEDQRTVYLNGQAYFDVKRDESRPFIVESAKSNVHVLGTSFDFRTTDESSMVNVNSGRVSFREIANPDNQVVLEKDEQGILIGNTISKKEGLDSESIAWRFEELVFRSTPLSEVVTTLEKFYKVKIVVEEDIKGCLISSSFKGKSLDEVLSVLEAIAEIKSNETNGVLNLSGPGC